MEGVAFVLEEVERIFIKHFCWIGLIVYTFVDDIFDRKSREPLFFQISFRYARTIKGPAYFFYLPAPVTSQTQALAIRICLLTPDSYI